MGIKGLLSALKPYTEPVHMKKYSGKRVGIDAYSWLHKGAYACSMEICEQKGSWQATGSAMVSPYVSYSMHRVNLLRFNGVIPVVVFDGGYLPMKASTEHERRRRREMNLEQARFKLSQGDIDGSNELFQRAVDISPAMANELVKVLRAEGVEFVVAPYEADAQLAWLAKLDPLMGGVSAVISEDSDLLAYGCPVVIFKMDKYGNGEEIRRDALFSKPAATCELSFQRFTHELFLGMCIMAGCDFLPSIPGIGIKKAHGLVLKYRKLDRVLSILRWDKKASYPEGYAAGFKQAMSIFLHAHVYDTNKRALTFLNPLPEGFEECFDGCIDFLGPDLPPSRAKAIAVGQLDPITMCAFDLDLPHPCAATPLQNKGDLICSPTSILEVVDLSDSEEGPDCTLVTAPAASKRPRTVRPLERGYNGIKFPQALPEATHPLADPPPLPVVPDKSFLAQLELIATNMKAKSASEDVWAWSLDSSAQDSGWKMGSPQREGTRDAQIQRSPVVHNNNPFKIQKIETLLCQSEGWPLAPSHTEEGTLVVESSAKEGDDMAGKMDCEQAGKEDLCMMTSMDLWQEEELNWSDPCSARTTFHVETFEGAPLSSEPALQGVPGTRVVSALEESCFLLPCQTSRDSKLPGEINSQVSSTTQVLYSTMPHKPPHNHCSPRRVYPSSSQCRQLAKFTSILPTESQEKNSAPAESPVPEVMCRQGTLARKVRSGVCEPLVNNITSASKSESQLDRKVLKPRNARQIVTKKPLKVKIVPELGIRKYFQSTSNRENIVD